MLPCFLCAAVKIGEHSLALADAFDALRLLPGEAFELIVDVELVADAFDVLRLLPTESLPFALADDVELAADALRLPSVKSVRMTMRGMLSIGFFWNCYKCMSLMIVKF